MEEIVSLREQQYLREGLEQADALNEGMYMVGLLSGSYRWLVRVLEPDDLQTLAAALLNRYRELRAKDNDTAFMIGTYSDLFDEYAPHGGMSFDWTPTNQTPPFGRGA